MNSYSRKKQPESYQQNKNIQTSESSSSNTYYSRDQSESRKKYIEKQNIQRQKKNTFFNENRNQTSITTINDCPSISSNQAPNYNLQWSQQWKKQKFDTLSSQTCINKKIINSSLERKCQIDNSTNKIHYPLNKGDAKSVSSQQCKQSQDKKKHFLSLTQLKKTQSQKCIKGYINKKQYKQSIVKQQKSGIVDDCMEIAFKLIKKIINFPPFPQKGILIDLLNQI